MKRIDIDSGSMQTLANAPGMRGGAWNRDGVILFTRTASSPILRMSATGGDATAVTRLEAPQQSAHRFPQFLPDGRHFLYYVQGTPEVRGVYVGQLDGSETRRLLDANAAAVYASLGHLLFVRQGTLLAQEFDPVRLTMSGDPSRVAADVTVDAVNNLAAVSASAAGSIVYRTGTAGGQRQFGWFDRSGKEIEKVSNPDSAGSNGPSMSPDGRRVALARTIGGNTDIWMLDLVRGVLGRFTLDLASDNYPIWSPDGTRVAFNSGRNRTDGVLDLYQKSAVGSGNEERLLATGETKVATDWSSDGRFLLYRSASPKTAYDIWALPLFGDRKPFPVVQTTFEERDAQFSLDGKWIAYQSNESGRVEIYVQPFPGPGIKTQISTTGGAQVRWRRDGKELFYVALDGRLMAVPIQLALKGGAIEAGTPLPRFATRIGGAVQGFDKHEYVVSPDGQRFLMNTITDVATTSPITVILHWKPKP